VICAARSFGNRSATIKAYVPLSGNAYLLDAIGAAFIGTTLSAEGRRTFPWQNVGTGVVIFLVLALSYSSRRLAAAR
jgi:ribose transport system permease protein